MPQLQSSEDIGHSTYGSTCASLDLSPVSLETPVSVDSEAEQSMGGLLPVKAINRRVYSAPMKYLGSMYIEIWIADHVATSETVSIVIYTDI